jgi:bifunctional UDP-N-acetylglucosamine pyrophosphorylase / glucosamine-1-phosphate N-acetyltransferase
MPRPPSKTARRVPAINSPLSVVILAAGQGRRMLSDAPKVLAPLAGEPLLAHVLALAGELNPAGIHVVVGYGHERVQERFRDTRVQWALQTQQLGTGHAVRTAMPAIADDHRVLILYGDVPLLRSQTLRMLLEQSPLRGLSLLTARFPQPYGYGRIVRDAAGKAKRIVEEADASAAERRIQEINTGVMAAPAALLKRWLTQIKPRNAQGEYYLTDVLAQAVRERCAVASVEAADNCEIMGVNDRLQLAEAESEYRRRRARELMTQGVTIVDPARIDLRGAVTAGRDVLIDVDVVMQGPVTLGDRTRIGSHCVLSDCTVGADAVIESHCVLRRIEVADRCHIPSFSCPAPGTRLTDESPRQAGIVRKRSGTP